jgi:hypothetical protein
MKSKIAVFAFCGLICSAGTLQAQTNLPNDVNDFETLTRTGIVGDMDQIQDFALNRAFRIFGNISGGTASSIAATRDDGSVFAGVINPSSADYAIVVPAGTYTVRVCHGTPTTATYDDSDPVTVTVDTRRDETVSGITTHVVSGTVSGLDTGTIGTIIFSSDDGRTSGSAFIFPGLNTYSANLPDGNYNAVVAQIDLATSGISLFPVGTVAVSGTDVMMDFAIGSRGRLSGTVTMKSIPPQSNMIALDSSAVSPTGFNCASTTPASGFGSVDQSSGAYALRLLTGYSYFLSGSFPIFPSDPPQTAGTWQEVDPVAVVFQGDTTRDEMVSAPTDTIVISGQVTAASDGGPNVGLGCILSAFGVRLPLAGTGPVAPPSTFARGTQTDSGGNYRLVVPRGLTYTMIVSGPAPMP